MIRGFYTAASNLVSSQTHLDIVANNIANINTTGFKPQQTGFSSLLYENINGGAGNAISMGHGVKVESAGIDFTQGELKNTDMPFDFAILGEGFFAIENGKGADITYTRDGSFRVFREGQKSYLADAAGNCVLDSQNRKIEIGEEFNCARIGVFRFSNPFGLRLTGGNSFTATETSGKPESVKNPDIKTGYLENSAVFMVREMVKMIEASKSFSFGSKVLQAADEMERVINQLR